MRYILITLILCSCSTPQTYLKNENGDLASCGGVASGYMMGGGLAYLIQKSNDADCVTRYKKEGYEITSGN